MGIVVLLVIAMALAFIVEALERTRRHEEKVANFSREWVQYLVEVTVPPGR